MLTIIMALVGALFAQTDNPFPQFNPFPTMNPADCQPVADYYGASVNPWMGDTWLHYPQDAERSQFDVHFADTGGVWVFRAESLPYMEIIDHFSKFEATPPNPTGEYPYTWGYHDVCSVVRVVHPLDWAWYEINKMWQRTYWAVALPYLIN